MEPCWYELNIPCENALNKDFTLPDTGGKEFGAWSYRAAQIFDQGWLKDLADKGLNVTSALVFFRKPGHNTHNAHLDIHPKHPIEVSSFGLNMIINGKDSYMTWYDTPKIEKAPTPGPAGTVYYNWPISTLNEIDRHILAENKITMVRVGIPHTVIMNSDSRWCISARCTTIERMYWKDIVQWMRDKNFLIERTATTKMFEKIQNLQFKEPPDFDRLKGDYVTSFGKAPRPALTYYKIKDMDYFNSILPDTMPWGNLPPFQVQLAEIIDPTGGHLLPHIDHNISACCNYYMQTGDSTTHFYKLKKDVKSGFTYPGRTVSNIFTLDQVTKVSEFTANTGDTYLLDVSNIHSVENPKAGVRRFITWQWFGTPFSNIANSLPQNQVDTPQE